MISNTNNNNGGVNSLRDVCNFLQPAMNAATLPPGTSAYDHIIDMIRGLDLQDDGIIMNQKIKSIETDFCTLVRDENMLCESMDYINDKALGDGETALKFALLFSSRNFDVLAMKETKVRSAMLKILETNFLNADTYRIQDKDRLYNSITLLGEYYHRVRLADNTPITILGESLLGLLIREVSDLEMIHVKLAKLILSQITLNGDMMRVKHKDELTQLLYHIRRNLIEQPALKPAVKALLLMTLDLYYSNFANLGRQLEEMYTKYLVQEDEDDGNNNLDHQEQQLQLPSPPMYQQPPQQQQPQPQPNYSQQEPQNKSFENGESENGANDSFEVAPTTKKWSEQVCEDSFYENEFTCESELNVSGAGSGSGGTQENQLNSSYEKGGQACSSNSRYDNDRDSSSRNSRRSYQPRSSPRPLKQSFNESSDPNQQQQQQSGEEERDQSKPLPRWRAPRFNRDASDQQEGHQHHHQQRRFSFDDDRQSVRSEGGSIRLYSINDRLKHSQEKIERSGANNYNSIANSNWDRQSQRDDRSERSYISNYERGNQRRGGGRHYNNRHTYDKPPRFQKNQPHQQQQPQQHNHHQLQNKDNKIYSDTWRRSHANSNSNNSYQDENSSYPSNGPESNSRSSSRARTLPRPAKSNMDGSSGSGGGGGTNAPNSYQHSQSPTHNNQQYQQRGPNARPRNYNARYSSQSSLASEASSTFDRRHNNNHKHQNRNNYARPQQQQQNWEDTHSVHGQPEEASWNSRDNNSELVRNARQTTKYMNYLSSQK